MLDVAVVFGGWTAVLVVSNITEEFKRSNERSLVMVAVAALTTLAIMERRGLYAGRPALPRTEEISRVFVAVGGGASAIAVSAAFLDWHIGAREILIGAVGVFGCRSLLRGLIRALAAEIPGADRPESVVIVGTGYEACELAELIVDHPESRFSLAGVVGNLSVAERSGLVDRWIGPTGRLIELMHQHEVTGAIVTANGFRGEQFRSITQQLFRSGYDVHLTTGVSRMGEGRFDVRSLSHEPLIVMERNRIRRSHLWAKRAIDLIGASIAMLVAAPIMAIVAALIWLEDRGPIIYTAHRAGRRGQFFPMYKFRSMVTNADELKEEMEAGNERTGPLFKMSNDPRITRIGRFIRETSIDELPQLINVIKGDMSLVGPRPALPEEEAVFDEELRDRFEVRPGITGLWQVEARSNAAFNAYRRLDLHYVENWTLSLDFHILLATVEQLIVTLALLPVRLLRRSAPAADGVAPGTSPVDRRRPAGIAATEDVVIDLRDRSRARLAARAESGGDPPIEHDPVAPSISAARPD
ncbi:MAG: sugar transferase [Acidimicrobiia bacterium]|nr:sugar transferase [Acidimicrobiia bacterium]